MSSLNYFKKLLKGSTTMPPGSGGGPSFHPDMTQGHEGAASNKKGHSHAHGHDHDHGDEDGDSCCGCGHNHHR